MNEVSIQVTFRFEPPEKTGFPRPSRFLDLLMAAQQLFVEETDNDSKRQTTTLCAVVVLQQNRVFVPALCGVTVASDLDGVRKTDSREKVWNCSV